jgi:mannose-6-phosphate isomerase-like protein (cupin superfamily)
MLLSGHPGFISSGRPYGISPQHRSRAQAYDVYIRKYERGINMYSDYNSYYGSTPVYNPYGYPFPYWANAPIYNPDPWQVYIPLRDYGPNPYVVNIHDAALQNNNFRLALWTGTYLQLTLMSINVGEDIGLEMHPDVDQFLRIEQGQGIVMMGDRRNNLNFRRRVHDGYVIFVPAGKWHNLVNTGRTPIKLYSIYAPPEHPRGTVHRTKRDAEKHHG